MHLCGPSQGLFHISPVPFSVWSKGILHGVALIFQEVDFFVEYSLAHFLTYATPGIQSYKDNDNTSLPYHLVFLGVWHIFVLT